MKMHFDDEYVFINTLTIVHSFEEDEDCKYAPFQHKRIAHSHLMKSVMDLLL